MSGTLFISDLDGTLLNPKAALSDFSAQALRGLIRDGLQFTIATARTWESACRVIAPILPLPVPVVLQNGALIFDTQTRRYVKKEIIAQEHVLELLRRFKRFGQKGFMYSMREDAIRPYHEDIGASPILMDFRAVRMPYYGNRFTEVLDLSEYAAEDIVYFTTQGTREQLEPLYQAVQSLPGLACVLYPDSYLAGNWYLECFSDRATKYNATQFLRKTYGFDRVVGFGDNLNDISLFDACDEGYAVANARPELKEIAGGTIGANTEDGVAQFLKERA